MNQHPHRDVSPEPNRPVRRSGRLATVSLTAAGVLGGALVGFVATMPTPTNASSLGIETPAAVSPTTVPTTTAPSTGKSGRADHSGRLRDSLQKLVDDGTLTPSQADAVAKHLADHRPGRGPGHRGGLAPSRQDADAFAKVLGLADGAELHEQLKAGTSIKAIAEANGVSLDTVKAYLRNQLAARLDDAVAAGRLDRAAADKKLAQADERIDAKLNSTQPPRPHRVPRRNGAGPGRSNANNAAKA